ncbi:MAG: DUF2029 domain-containing protein [Hyphomicrobiales bacterium]|nr:MAG: DUF2029 domain-containing protein [Hyphomicrobiales bacterium]
MTLAAPRPIFVIALVVALLIAYPILVNGYLPAQWPLDATDHAIGRDFVNLWGAGRLILDGQWPALFSKTSYLDGLHRVFHPSLAPHFWSYPPTNFFLAVPLALLPYAVSLAVWTLLGLGAMLWAAGIGLSTTQRHAVIVLLLIAPATFTNIISGQNGFFSAALLAGTFLLLDERPVIAGVLCGLLSLKPHLAIVAMPALLALGAWRVIFWAGVTAVGVALASVTAFGWGPWQSFVLATVPAQGAMLKTFTGFFTTMVVSPYGMLRHLGLQHDAAMAAQAVVSVATVAAAMIAVRRTQDATLRLGFVAAATFVASPYALTYDMPIIALVIARFAVRDGETAWPAGLAGLYCAVLALPLAAPALAFMKLPLAAPLPALLFLSLAIPLLPLKQNLATKTVS